MCVQYLNSSTSVHKPGQRPLLADGYSRLRELVDCSSGVAYGWRLLQINCLLFSGRVDRELLCTFSGKGKHVAEVVLEHSTRNTQEWEEVLRERSFEIGN
jgi:hypothetical protein